MPDVLSIASAQALFESFTIDGIVIAVLFAAVFFYVLKNGKEQVISLILALYIALVAFVHFPYKEKFLLFTNGDMALLASNALVFGVFVVIGFLAVSPILRNRYVGYGGGNKWLESALLSAATVALLIAFSYHVLPIASFYALSDAIAKYFAPSQFFFWWLIVPVFVLLFVGRR